MKYERIIFSGHAIRQMFCRNLAKDDIIEVIENGKVLIEYSEDKPYPSYLALGFVGDVPLHVVYATVDQQKAVVITAYVLDTKIWDKDFKTRR